MTKLFCILSLLINFEYGHDIQMAIFEIYEGKSGLEMTVSVDKEDFLETLAVEFVSRVQQNEVKDLALEYLESRVTIKVNGHCTSFNIHEVEFGELNIHLKGSLDLKVSKVEKITITNTCMIDLFDGHDNIIKLKLNDRHRSFRLNRDRTSTVATYQ